MSYKLIKDMSKTPDQQWYLWLNTERSLGSTPDPRDSTLSYTDDEKAVILDYLINRVRTQPGYIGWDREYIGDDLLRTTYQFETETNARTFRRATHDINDPLFINFQTVTENKAKELSIPLYTVTWVLYDEQGNTLQY
jgi:hypothetical protein